MFKSRKFYPSLALVAVTICLILLSNCGGGGNSSVVPNTNPTTENPVSYTNPTPTPVLSNVNVSGYLYVNNTVTEDGETVPSISVLEVPACLSDSSGNESFLTQFSNSIKADYPEDWARPEVQELYNQLNKTLSESKPLPECNGQVYSVYSENPIPVGSDGHFDNTVLTGATDSNVKLEVALGEDNYAEVETLPSSGSINSSDATSAAVLKSCPEKIFAFPGEILIFKVYSEPGINLKSAGLRFILDNPSIGCITQPVYLCLFGAHKYQVAYGCVYIKPGLDTPVDTTITAKLNSGQSMSIFLEVIKKTVSVSGTVYTGGSSLIKGYVKSLGPKACCKIDASGNYTLPKVFRGHSRSVIATWWTSKNGKKVRHREERVINFLNSDVTDFNFGVLPSTDLYIDEIAEKVMEQKFQWEQTLGLEVAVEKTVNWLNRKELDPPVPQEISEAITKAEIDSYDSKAMRIYFRYGVTYYFPNKDKIRHILEENDNVNDKQSKNEVNLVLSPSMVANSSNDAAETVKNSKILVLSPFTWQLLYSFNGHGVGEYTVNWLLSKLKTFPFYADGKFLEIRMSDTPDYPLSEAPITLVKQYDWLNRVKPEILCKLKSGFKDKVIRPQDFENLGDYGIIYIDTHGDTSGLYCCPYYLNEEGKVDDKLDKWLNNPANNGLWEYVTLPANPAMFITFLRDAVNVDVHFKCIYLKKEFFDKQQNFDGSLVFINACESYFFHLHGAFSNARVYLGHNVDSRAAWGADLAFYYFYCMIKGYIPLDKLGQDFSPDMATTLARRPYIKPFPEPPTDRPMSVIQAYNMLQKIGANPNTQDPNYPIGGVLESKLFIDTHGGEHENVYFPTSEEITVHKK